LYDPHLTGQTNDKLLFNREKMWSALEEDECLDGITTQLNDYAHIPDRWACDADDTADPQYMHNDEYAKWVRKGMWE